ncbi:MAG: hypothetical protein R3F05_18065 [Planctomycetota bacterium]
MDTHDVEVVNLERVLSVRLALAALNQVAVDRGNCGLVLIGHSLGGSIVTAAANLLAQVGVGVDDVVLYDRYYTDEEKSVFQVARGILDWENLLQGEPDKDKDNLTAAAREDVGRVYHVMAAKNTSAILKKIEREGGGSRPTVAMKSVVT